MSESRQREFHVNGEVREPLVSVGLPTFNRAASLERAVRSVLAQDYQNLELVISDNGSNDRTEQLCTDYALRDSRVKYIRQTQNNGAHLNFLTVLQQARGQYFMWLGDDDWLDHSYITRCLSVLTARSDYSLVCGSANYYDADQLAFVGVQMDLLQESPTERVLDFFRRVSDNGTFYGLVARDLLSVIPVQEGIGSDWLLVAALALRGKIRTLGDVKVNRSCEGVSANLQSLAVQSGVAARKAQRPYQAIAENVFHEIRRASPSFGSLNVLARLLLACRATRILYSRFIVNEHPVSISINRVRYRLKLRTRFKRALGIE